MGRVHAGKDGTDILVSIKHGTMCSAGAHGDKEIMHQEEDMRSW